MLCLQMSFGCLLKLSKLYGYVRLDVQMKLNYVRLNNSQYIICCSFCMDV